MKHQNEKPKESDAALPAEGSGLAEELSAFELRISEALHAEALEEVGRLEAFGSDLRADPIGDEESFVEALRDQWHAEETAVGEEPAEITEGIAGPTKSAQGPNSSQRPRQLQQQGQGQGQGQTAVLPPQAASSGMPRLRAVAGAWWAGAAAAVLLAGALGISGLLGDGEEASGASNVMGASLTGDAVYLGAGNGTIPSSDKEVPNRGPSTVPRVLPQTVDFSMGGSIAGSFRIEIHDTSRDSRIDEVPGSLMATVYEPRWTCSEAERAKLPAVFWVEVYRSVDPPGADVVWKELFARQ